jgi:hypothetical protein
MLLYIEKAKFLRYLLSVIGPIVYRLGRDLLKVESGVRLPVGSQINSFPMAMLVDFLGLAGCDSS